MNDIIQQTTRWFEMAHSDAKVGKRTVQLGVHFEEVAEMLGALVSKDNQALALIREAENALVQLSEYLKENSKTTHIYPHSDNLLLDALCDQAVTLAGVAYDYGYKFPQALREVNRSNFSKFVDGLPVFNETGKVMKGAGYTPPNLDAYIA
ncbi:hypothetical protein [Aurantimicrobium sp.]|uniref:hypothetical protein n=1 Tax=Aurantimicrobium sp. TaxID=1930784 RepID=UPI002FC7B838